jgi:hypothetical protein
VFANYENNAGGTKTQLINMRGIWVGGSNLSSSSR